MAPLAPTALIERQQNYTHEICGLQQTTRNISKICICKNVYAYRNRLITKKWTEFKAKSCNIKVVHHLLICFEEGMYLQVNTILEFSRK